MALNHSHPFTHMGIHRGTQSLGAVLGELIDKMGIQKKMDAATIIETWATLAGPQVNRHTDSVWFKHGRLYVKIRSASWRQHLHMERTRWCQALNREIGRELVREVVFK
ncbi:MAG: DUF721 domain-containing protein [Bacteroidota bacterium]